MANAPKQGLDYFSLSVDFVDDIKVRKIMRACGTQSIAVLISLLSRIYRFEGYFVVWDVDVRFLIADHVGVKESLVQEIVNKAVDAGFFDADIFQKRNVLTSRGIQKRFFEATSRRKQVFYDATLMLISQDVYINAIDVYINPIDVCINQQSKVKESKVKNKEKDMPDKSGECTPNDFCFDDFWKMYPKKVAKKKVKSWWKSHVTSEKRAKEIVDGLKRWAASDGWTKNSGLFVPYPMTFLNQERWLDDVPEGVGNVGKSTAEDFENKYKQLYANR